MAAAPPLSTSQSRDRRTTALACLALALGMVGAAYASVPLYNLFCRLTGFDGTPMVGTTAPDRVLARVVTVRFDVNVSPGLSWSFAPEVAEVKARLGETQTVFFRVQNTGPRASVGVSTFNVTPGQIAPYFVKLKCFCYEEQALGPGESMDFPVVFYIDPKIAEERNLDGLGSATLSYTYFPSRGGQPVAAVSGKPKL